jgi:hypothetical protein
LHVADENPRTLGAEGHDCRTECLVKMSKGSNTGGVLYLTLFSALRSIFFLPIS